MDEVKQGERLLTIKETAKVLHISERKLHNLIEIPRIRIGRSVRFDPRDIAAFIETRRVVGQ